MLYFVAWITFGAAVGLCVSDSLPQLAYGLMPAMFRPLECYVGLRYVWSRRRRGLVSFMSGASLLGIGLGVAALIVILSVMNGLETEARNRLLSLSAHASFRAGQSDRLDIDAASDYLAEFPGVTGVAPFITIEGMLAVGSRLYPALVRGVDPVLEQQISSVSELMAEGSFSALERVADGIVVGRALALNLALSVGDKITLLHARVVNGQPRPSLVPLTIVGIFSAGIAEHDAGLALINIEAAARLAEQGDAARSLALRVSEPLNISALRARVMADPKLAGWLYSDWSEEHRSHFRAIKIEKVMMTVILMLIVAVAAFNIVASLMMVVNEKNADIAILRTLGLEPGRVASIFIFQGAVLGAAGTVLGGLLGTFLALNVETIVPWLESTFGFQIMPGDVYYVTQIPSELHAADVAGICFFAIVIALAATFFPSRRAARVAPAEALRYD